LRGYRPILSIEITRECPLSCPGCYAYGNEHLNNGLALRDLRDLRGEALVNGVLNVVRRERPLQVSIVGGEPLIRHKELSAILPVLSEWNIYTLVVTSAVIPFPAEWCSIPGVRIAVSIDGLQPEHDRRRAPATYEEILGNIQGRRMDISWVITNPMLQRDGYLDEYLSFWTSRPEVGRIWVSLYTPQNGEKSEERLTRESRRVLVERLPRLKRKYPAIILGDGAIEAFAHPPRDPASCTFAQMSSCYSADLRTSVKPCFFGGNPDCSECGCAISTSLHWLHNKKVKPGFRAGAVIDTSLSIGRTWRRMTRSAV
jgi:MoaA/NifB/PqqE/SkfB family radical SAM enzyme